MQTLYSYGYQKCISIFTTKSFKSRDHKPLLEETLKSLPHYLTVLDQPSGHQNCYVYWDFPSDIYKDAYDGYRKM